MEAVCTAHMCEFVQRGVEGRARVTRMVHRACGSYTRFMLCMCVCVIISKA